MLIKPRLALALALLGGLVIAAVVLYHNPPGRSWITPPCMMHKLTTLHCPGCGSTRATYALLHGDLGDALRKNVLFVTALPFLGVWAVRRTTSWLQGRCPAPVSIRVQLYLGWVAIAAVLLFTVLRNLPWAPFSWLAPH